ncbi:hypothetical protein [Methanoculleus sp.]|uniref:hypothetical protein n=1 Tax=Methanoculleus sp. TaxID=90427 RepID=UPI0025EBBC8A|nr:hypothetical protein [Methanoculleus sp.]MCK9319905.1 hypothetical protein [Methanoculleus sp.]
MSKEKSSKKWYKTWWGIPLIVLGSILLLCLIIGINSLNKLVKSKDCNQSIQNQFSITDCPKLDCLTCPTKIETKTEINTVTETIYVCSDLTEVQNKEDCIDFDKNGWYEVKTITANSTIKSEPIIITENIWRYTWSCKSTASINNQDVSLVYLVFCDINATDCDWMNNNKSVIFSSNCVSGDTSYVYNGKGTYYVDISGANFKNLEIKVEAKKN